MSRDILAALKTLFGGNQVSTANLLEIKIAGTTYRFTDVSTVIPSAGFDYKPFPFKYGSIKQGLEIGQITIQTSGLVEIDGIKLSKYVQSNDISGSFVSLKMVDQRYADEQIVLFEGIISSISGVEKNSGMSIVVRSEVDFKGADFPSCSPTKFCNLKFKGTKCGYTGTETTTCGKKWEDCVAKNNTVNFRGIPWSF